MKITSITPHLLTADLRDKKLAWASGSIQYWTTVLVEVKTDEGVTGLAEVYQGLRAPEPVKALIEQFGGLLVGQKALDIPACRTFMRSRSTYWGRTSLPLAVQGAIENALWDVLGKVKNAPVWQLLGGKAHERLLVYASGGLYSEEKRFTRELEAYLEQGFRAVKIRTGGSMQDDIAKVKLARKVLGDDVDLMVDAVMGSHHDPWSGKEALRRAKTLEEFNLVWLEEPVGSTDYDGLALIRANTTIPIAGGESATGLAEYRQYFDAGALDWVQPDPAHSGGILECLAVAALARAHGVKVAYHSWGMAPCLWANYHLAFNDPTSRYLEFPTHGCPHLDELTAVPFELKDGCFECNSEPGFGVQLPREIIGKYPYRPETVHVR